MEPLILAVDSGTGSTRALLFDATGTLVAATREELAHRFPRPGWVEQDASEIFTKTRAAIAATLAKAPRPVAAIGIANQRETILFWSKSSGEPLAPAIVWQDRRTAGACRALREQGLEPLLQRRTGLVVDPYFSASKIKWTLQNRPEVMAAARRHDLAIGTVESWLLFKLIGVHQTDASNASRTQLMDLGRLQWADDLLDLFDIPRDALPEITGMTGRFATTRLFGAPIPITGLAGDQQAATIGQGCNRPGLVKCTFGTGIFMLGHAGATPPESKGRLLSTLLVAEPRAYALEGAIFVGGDAVKWLRDQMHLIETAAETEELAQAVADSGGLVFVPAFHGLGAPWWAPEARGLVTGIASATTPAHLARATLEAMGNQTADLVDAFRADGVAPETLRIDGGMVENRWLCRDVADATGLAVELAQTIETTALGAAILAAAGIGLFPDLATAQHEMAHRGARIAPRLDARGHAVRQQRWRRAIRQVLAGVAEDAEGKEGKEVVGPRTRPRR